MNFIKSSREKDIRLHLIGVQIYLFIFLTLLIVVPDQSAFSAQAQGILTAEHINKVKAEGGFAGLMEKAGKTGKVLIIVGMDTDFSPVGALSVSQAVAQKERIASAQNTFLAELSGLSLANVKRFQFIPYVAVTVDETVLKAILASPLVRMVEEDVPVPPTLDLSVPRIGGPSAWQQGYTGNGQTIAILDTGVDKNHSFLTGKVISEACYSTNYGSSVQSVCPGGITESTAADSALPYGGNCPAGECDHGTHVAGIAAGGSGGSISGIAYNAKIIAVQVFSRVNSSDVCGGYAPCAMSYTSDQIKGLERVYALRNTYAISSVNMSLGGGHYTSQSDCDSQHSSTKSAIDNLRSVNIATVISSGNSGYSDGMAAPACISSAVSVGATTDSDAVASYSDSVSFLNLLAPGSGINSSIPGGGYANWNGTSMAAPHVAGAWAILKQASTNASVSTVISALSTTGLSITDSRNNVTKKRINVNEALTSILGGGSCSYSLNPAGANYAAGGGTGTVNVAAQSACSWTATSGSSWITVTSGSSGSGNGSVGYSVAANTGSQRTGNISIAGQQTFTVTQSGVQTVYTLAVSKSGTGSGTVASSPSGINCGSTCSASYAQGTSVTLTATPGSGSAFTGWSGGCSGIGTCTVAMNSSITVTAAFTPANPPTIGNAVDNTSLTWTTGGNANWAYQTITFCYAGDAARSGAIDNNGSTWLQTTIAGPGQLSFYWKVRSEVNYDFLRFYIDGSLQKSISGDVNWQREACTLSSGIHTLKWEYSKDAASRDGEDAGWLDKVDYCAQGLCSFSPVNISTNSIGSRNTLKITDMSGLLSATGAAITVHAWDAQGRMLVDVESESTVPLRLYNKRTTTITGSDLMARFPESEPSAYEVSIYSPALIITNVKNSSDGTLNIPVVYTRGVANYHYASNSIGSRNMLKITDMSGLLPAGGGAITVSAWDASGNAIPQASNAVPLKIYSHRTTTITGSDLAARFPTGSPMTYEFFIDSSKVVITNVKASADGSINIPTVCTSGVSNFVSNSTGPRNTLKITDVSGSLPGDGGAITVTAWDTSGNVIPEASNAAPLKLYSRGTTTITGSDLAARFPGGSPMTYEFSINSSKIIVTNVKSSSDGIINIPTVYTSGMTNFAANYVSSRNSIKITDMSGSLPVRGGAITVTARDASGNAIPQAGNAAPLKLYNRGTTTITGSDLAARFPGGSPMTYEFSIDSSKVVVTNFTGSADGTINIPSVYTCGLDAGI